MISAKAVIGVPLYNEAKYIASTLECLALVPEAVDVKFFVSDNQSTDGSFDIVREWAEKDKRFHIHQHKTNIGAADNFNYVFNKSRSPYFMWLGAHDQIDPGYVAAAIEILDSHDDAAYAAGEPYAFIDDPAPQTSKPLEDARYEFHDSRIVRYLQSVAKLSNCTIVNSMFRRSFTDDFEFRTTISNDHVLISHLLWHGKIYYTEGQKYYRRFFREDRGSRDERVTGAKTVKLDRLPFYEYYVDDFIRLYNRSGPLQDYLCNKILAILEQRFSLLGFDEA